MVKSEYMFTLQHAGHLYLRNVENEDEKFTGVEVLLGFAYGSNPNDAWATLLESKSKLPYINFHHQNVTAYWPDNNEFVQQNGFNTEKAKEIYVQREEKKRLKKLA